MSALQLRLPSLKLNHLCVDSLGVEAFQDQVQQRVEFAVDAFHLGLGSGQCGPTNG